MANRHERRKIAKVIRTEVVRLTPDDARRFLAAGSMCAWEGCTVVSSDPAKDGWSWMVLYKGDLQPNFMAIAPGLVTRDCALCPKHACHLDEHLLADIGGRLRNVAGSA